MKVNCRDVYEGMVIVFIIAVLPMIFMELLFHAAWQDIVLTLYAGLVAILIGGALAGGLRCMGGRYYLIILLLVLVLGYIYISLIYYPFAKQAYEEAMAKASEKGKERAERLLKALDPYLSSCTPVTKLHGCYLSLYSQMDNHLKKVIHSAV